MIIGLSGYAQSGKDEVAKILVEEFGFKRVAFADAVRFLLYEVNPVINELANDIQHSVDLQGWDEVKKVPAVRTLLQDLGLGARKLFGDQIWVEQAFKQLSSDVNTVFTDVRFTNEADIIKLNKGQIWRVKRPGIEPVNTHISENDMDGYPVDKILKNEGSLDDLRELVRKRMAFSLNAD
jgi:hypothetical protein